MFAEKGDKAMSIEEDIDPHIEEDIIINFPAPKKYIIDVEVTAITRRKMRFVIDEVECDD